MKTLHRTGAKEAYNSLIGSMGDSRSEIMIHLTNFN